MWRSVCVSLFLHTLASILWNFAMFIMGNYCYNHIYGWHICSYIMYHELVHVTGLLQSKKQRRQIKPVKMKNIQVHVFSLTKHNCRSHILDPFWVRVALKGCWADRPSDLLLLSLHYLPRLFVFMAHPSQSHSPPQLEVAAWVADLTAGSGSSNAAAAAAAAISSPLMSSEGGAGPHAQSVSHNQRRRKREREIQWGGASKHQGMLFVPILSHETLKPSWWKNQRTNWCNWADAAK